MGKKTNVSDSLLREAIREFERGLYEADLGHHLFKRISLHGEEKVMSQNNFVLSAGRKIVFFWLP